MPDVLVTGGTGNLGVELVPRLVQKGYAVRVLSRRQQPSVAAGARVVRGDLTTGAGISEAVAGVDVIVHCASGTGTAQGLLYRSARRTDVEATQRLLDAAKTGGGQPYVVFISIVGVDRIPLGYYRAKHETEQVIGASGLPYTILRTTQWHSLAWELSARLARFPVMILPKGFRSQLLAPAEVADRMVFLVERGPAGMVSPLGGPEVLTIHDIARGYLRATGKRRALGAVRFPGKAMAAFRAGHNLCPDQAEGRITWNEWLAAKSADKTVT